MSLPPWADPATLGLATSGSGGGSDSGCGSGSDLARATAQALGPHGALAQADPGFVQREPQLRLADAMARAIDDRATLVA